MICAHCRQEMMPADLGSMVVDVCPSKARLLDHIDALLADLEAAEEPEEVEALGELVDAIELATLANGI